jgi:hypothetical protein
MTTTESTLPMVVQIPQSQGAALSLLRHESSIQLCLEQDAVWLWSERTSPELQRQYLQLPGARRYELHNNQELTLLGDRVPSAKLPAGPWMALSEWLTLERPVAQLPTKPSSLVSLRLVSSQQEQPVAGLLTRMSVWLPYVIETFAPKYAHCRFVMSAADMVWIQGTPLPALPGTYFYERSGIWLPAGLTWAPDLQPAIVRQLLKITSDEIVLWQADGQLARIKLADFVQATRSAVRYSARERGPR